MAGDKRIRELTDPGVTPLLSDFLPYDRNGVTEAMRTTVQQIVNLVQNNVSTQFRVFSGSANPDNVNGNNGDLYFRIAGSAMFMSQKISGEWVQIFEYSSSGLTIQKTQADLSDYGGGNFYLPVAALPGRLVTGARQDFTDGVTPSQFFTGVSPDGSRIDNFTSNALSTITIYYV